MPANGQKLLIGLGIFGVATAIYLTTRETHAAPAPTPQRYSCPYCNETFATQEELAAHIAQVHQAPPVFVCPYCGLSFVAEEELVAHIPTCPEYLALLPKPPTVPEGTGSIEDARLLLSDDGKTYLYTRLSVNWSVPTTGDIMVHYAPSKWGGHNIDIKAPKEWWQFTYNYQLLKPPITAELRLSVKLPNGSLQILDTKTFYLTQYYGTGIA